MQLLNPARPRRVAVALAAADIVVTAAGALGVLTVTPCLAIHSRRSRRLGH